MASTNIDMIAMPKKEFKRLIAGAIYDFSGFLTTLKEPVTLSSAHDASVIVELIKEFAEKRDIDDADPDVNWDKMLEGNKNE